MTTQEELQRRIRELEKEVAHLHSQIKHQQYGLVWLDVPEAFDEESETKIPILEEVPELAIHHDDGKPTHILIEGDNYHALTCLNYTHKGKVDVIYIDPPYNTGSDGFTYKDKRFLEKFPDGTKLPTNHPLRHSCWLSFMEKRLRLAYDLLRDDGVMYISIGDDEVAQLSLLCNTIMERIAIVSRIAKKGSDQGTHFRPTKDYVLVYAKNKSAVKGFEDTVLPEGLDRDYPFTDDFSTRKYRKAHSLFQASLDPMRGCKNQRYYIQAPDGTLIIPPGEHFPTISKEGEKIEPQSRRDKVWRWSVDSFLSKKNRIMFAKSQKSPLVDCWGNHTDWNVYEKKYQDEEEYELSNSLPNDVVSNYTNALGTSRLSDYDIDFAFSKPYELVRYLIEITRKRKDAIILDFFAGSGTTMDAVMQLNESDNGTRQSIMVQLNEDNISQGITYLRNKRVMEGYTNKKGKKFTSVGNSLKYYRTAFVGKNKPKDATDEDKLTLSKKAGCLLALAENTLYEQKSTDFYQIYSDEKGHSTAIYFQEDGAAYDEFLNDVEHINGKRTVYIFSWGTADEFRSDFEMMKDVTVKSIPQPILDIYKSLNQ